MSPAPADMMGGGHLAYPPQRMYPMRMMAQAPPHTDELYQQWLKNQQSGQEVVSRPLEMPAQAYAAGGCRMQNVNWHAQFDEFSALCDIQGGLDSNSGTVSENSFIFLSRLSLILKYISLIKVNRHLLYS